jgi:O-antigen ligase
VKSTTYEHPTPPPTVLLSLHHGRRPPCLGRGQTRRPYADTLAAGHPHRAPGTARPAPSCLASSSAHAMIHRAHTRPQPQLRGPRTLNAYAAPVNGNGSRDSEALMLRFGVVHSRLSDKLLILVALFGVVLMQAPNLLHAATGSRLVMLVPFLLAISITSAEIVRPIYSPPGRTVLALWFYLVVVVVTIMRGVGSEGSTETTRSAALFCLQFAILAWFSYRLLASAQTDEQRWWRLVALALSPAVFVAFNLLIMKFKLPFITVPEQAKGSANGTTATYLRVFGTHATRSNLPLASGVNGSGAISAAGFAAAAILALRVRRPSRFVTVPAAGLCAYATLMSDSHAALLIALGIIALFAILPHARRFSGIAVIAAISPAIVLAGLGFLASAGIGFLGRGNGNITTVNNRLYIWRAAWSTIQQADLYHVVVGYGAYGQVTSGASRNYAALFEGVSMEPLRNTVHDLPLQTMLDGGLIALVALVLLVVAVFHSLSRVVASAPSPPIQALSAILILFLLNGATEALPSYLFPESLAGVLLVAGAALALAPRAVIDPAEKPAGPPVSRPTATRRLSAIRSRER